MKKEFSVVFHNYDSHDLNAAVFEFNQFCKGDHPCYSGRAGTSLIKFDGSKGTKEMRIRDKAQRAIYVRERQAINRMIIGTSHRPAAGETADDFYSGKVEEGSITMYKEIVD